MALRITDFNKVLIRVTSTAALALILILNNSAQAQFKMPSGGGGGFKMPGMPAGGSGGSFGGMGGFGGLMGGPSQPTRTTPDPAVPKPPSPAKKQCECPLYKIEYKNINGDCYDFRECNQSCDPTEKAKEGLIPEGSNPNSDSANPGYFTTNEEEGTVTFTPIGSWSAWAKSSGCE